MGRINWDSIYPVLLIVLPILLGWGLGEATSLVRHWWERRRIRDSLETELSDIRSWLQLAKKTILYYGQRITLREQPTGVPILPRAHIYNEHYATVAPYLSFNERMSFTSIHNLLDSTRELVEFLKQEGLDADYAFRSLKAAHGNVYTALRHIDFHIGGDLRRQGTDQLAGTAPALDAAIDAEFNEAMKTAVAIGKDAVDAAYHDESKPP
jgi:hypothetical protein